MATPRKHNFVDPEKIMKEIPTLNFGCFDGEIPESASYLFKNSKVTRTSSFHCNKIRDAIFDLLHEDFYKKNKQYKNFKGNSFFGKYWNLQYHIKEGFSKFPKEDQIDIFDEILRKVEEHR